MSKWWGIAKDTTWYENDYGWILIRILFGNIAQMDVGLLYFNTRALSSSLHFIRDVSAGGLHQRHTFTWCLSACRTWTWSWVLYLNVSKKGWMFDKYIEINSRLQKWNKFLSGPLHSDVSFGYYTSSTGWGNCNAQDENRMDSSTAQKCPQTGPISSRSILLCSALSLPGSCIHCIRFGWNY